MDHLQPNSVVSGKYRLERELAAGGMGSVWLAQHLQLDAPVAVKFMHPGLLEVTGAMSRFEREAKAAAQIRSPYVVHVYDHGIDSGTPFIVMEYLEGEDLGARIKHAQRMPLAEVQRIVVQMCKGLDKAHKLGIVHRDLKPGNIFLALQDDDMVKILDFGIAKETGTKRTVQGETTTTGQLLGSPHYMSPEQVRGSELDARSDLWSVAVIIYRMLTGKRLFDAKDIGDLIVRICMDPLPRVSAERPNLGPALDAFFDKALCRAASGRYQTARELADGFTDAVRQSAAYETVDEMSVSSWESRTSGPGSGGSGTVPAPDELPTVLSDSNVVMLDDDAEPTRTPIDASRTLTGAYGQLHARRRRRMALVGAGAVTLLVLGGVVAAGLFGGAGDGAAANVTTAASTPVATAASVVAPEQPSASASASAAPEASADVAASSSAAASAATSASAAPKKAPPRRFIRRRPPRRSGGKKVDVGLGY